MTNTAQTDPRRLPAFPDLNELPEGFDQEALLIVVDSASLCLWGELVVFVVAEGFAPRQLCSKTEFPTDGWNMHGCTLSGLMAMRVVLRHAVAGMADSAPEWLVYYLELEWRRPTLDELAHARWLA